MLVWDRGYFTNRFNNNHSSKIWHKNTVPPSPHLRFTKLPSPVRIFIALCQSRYLVVQGDTDIQEIPLMTVLEWVVFLKGNLMQGLETPNGHVESREDHELGIDWYLQDIDLKDHSSEDFNQSWFSNANTHVIVVTLEWYSIPRQIYIHTDMWRPNIWFYKY